MGMIPEAMLASDVSATDLVNKAQQVNVVAPSLSTPPSLSASGSRWALFHSQTSDVDVDRAVGRWGCCVGGFSASSFPLFFFPVDPVGVWSVGEINSNEVDREKTIWK